MAWKIALQIYNAMLHRWDNYKYVPKRFLNWREKLKLKLTDFEELLLHFAVICDLHGQTTYYSGINSAMNAFGTHTVEFIYLGFNHKVERSRKLLQYSGGDAILRIRQTSIGDKRRLHECCSNTEYVDTIEWISHLKYTLTSRSTADQNHKLQ